MENATFRVGVDLGGTKIAVGAVSTKGDIVAEAMAPTGASEGFEAVVERIAHLVKGVQSVVGGKSKTTMVGVAAAGQIDLTTGTVRYAPNLDWLDAPLGRVLEEKLGLKVSVDNDVRAATLGEYLFGIPDRPSTFYNVYAGTGIGSGFVVYGRLLRGHSNSAGEIGHHSVQFDGPQCRCGNHGCLELYSSGSGLARQTQEALRAGRKSRLLEMTQNEIDAVDGRMVALAAREGDDLAREMIEKAGRVLGVGLANIVNLFNPEVLMLGGGFLNVGDSYVDAARESLARCALPGCAKTTRFVVSRMGVAAAIVGASCLGLIDQTGQLTI